jgi:hypothetical protein
VYPPCVAVMACTPGGMGGAEGSWRATGWAMCCGQGVKGGGGQHHTVITGMTWWTWPQHRIMWVMTTGAA